MLCSPVTRAVHFIDRSEEQNVLRYTENVAADGEGIDDLEDDDLEYGEFLGTLTHRRELKKPEGAMILASEQGPDSEDE